MGFGGSSGGMGGGMSFGTSGSNNTMNGTNTMGGSGFGNASSGFGMNSGTGMSGGLSSGFGMGGGSSFGQTTTSAFGSNMLGGNNSSSGFGTMGNSGGFNSGSGFGMGGSSMGMGGSSMGMGGSSMGMGSSSMGMGSGNTMGMGSGNTMGMGGSNTGTGFFGNSNNMSAGYNTFGTSTSGMGSNLGNFRQNNLKNMSDDGSVEDLIQISQEYGFDRLKMQHCRLKSVIYEILRQDAVAIQQGRVNRKPPYVEQSRWDQAKRKANQLTEKLNLSKGGERVVRRFERENITHSLDHISDEYRSSTQSLKMTKKKKSE